MSSEKPEPGPTGATQPPSASTSSGATRMPALLIMFICSGCAALIYEVVWFQLLQLVIGSSAVSLGILLGTFMGGIGLGSLFLPRCVSTHVHPLAVYAIIEAGIGVSGLLVLWVQPLMEHFYAAVGGAGPIGLLLRAVVAALCLLTPTILLGASFPAIARCAESSATDRVSRLGLLYGGNIVGAVCGCLLAGFYLLRFYDVPTATYVAVAINAAIACLSYALSRRTHYEPECPADSTAPKARSAPMARRSVYLATGLSGLTALGAEVVWTRLLSVMFGATVYTFAIILAVFLAGLGLGSGVASHLARHVKHLRLALGVCQLLLAVAIAWTAYAMADSLPNWPVDPLLAKSAVSNFEVDFVRCMWAVFPAACLWGASFPLALASLADATADPGDLAGTVYFANTVGGVCGALAFSIVLIPAAGTTDAQRLLIGLAAVSGLVAFAPDARRLAGRDVVAVIASVVAVIWMIANVAPVPWLVLAYGRRMILQLNPGRALYVGEGRNYSVVISEPPNGDRYFHVAGKVEASTALADMRLQRMLGDIPALFHPDPKSVLVVGLGAGVTAGSFVPDPAVQKITICELEPLVPPAADRYFREQNFGVTKDRRTTIHDDDARDFLLTSKERFDVVTSDPIHPWVKGMSSLYSKQYFELVRDHLMPGGMVTQWVPLYESDLATVKIELATFFDVFPNGTVWGNTADGRGIDLVLLGQVEPLHVNVDALQARWGRADYSRFTQSTAAVDLHTVTDVLSTYAGRADDLRSWLAGTDINDDMSMRLQYLAGIGLNFNDPDWIYTELLRYRHFPRALITGSELRMHPIEDALSGRNR